MATTQQEVKAMKQEIADLKNLLADHVEETAANGASKTIMAKDELQQLAHHAGKGVRNFMSQKHQQLDEAKVSCQKTIKERPLTSAAIAFAGGAVLAALLSKKS